MNGSEPQSADGSGRVHVTETRSVLITTAMVRQPIDQGWALKGQLDILLDGLLIEKIF